jgi:hypothetical protein
MIRKVWLGLAALACVLALPAAAHAQSAIAGVVKDSSGAVLPGVTVEAASPALIEKSKIAVTDGSGAYKIIDLRPGTYLVTFTLTGFQTFKREGLELPSDFTANVDATMKVGALEESVTVSGASPVVDVQSNVKSQVLSRDVLDAVPNAHTIQSVGQLIPGVTLTSPDVAGSAQMQQTYFSVHGSGASGTSLTIDGMIINGLQGDGAIQTYMNDSGAQEMVYRTGGGGGDQQSGGLLINVVPREGGNKFSGSFNFGWEKWQSDNFTQELKNLGVTSVDKLGTYHDLDATEGGPVKKDRLWFFASGRLSKEDKPVANTTNSAANGIESVLTDAGASFNALLACRAAAASGGCPQGTSPEVINSGLARLTLQLNSKNKLSAYIDRIHKDRASAMGSGDDQRITGVHWTSPLYATDTVKWTSTLSSRLLLQGGFSSNLERYNNLYQDGLEQPLYGPLWASLATRNNSTEARRAVTGAPEYGSYPDRYNWQASASYVTGTHNIAVGFQDSYGPYNQRYYTNGDLQENFNDTTLGTWQPLSATIYATSPVFAERLNAALGVYAQDSWTTKRLTVNYGLRWDYLSEQVNGQPIQQGTFAIIPAFNDIPMPKQKNLSPHLSVIYDLFGSGKTAVRAGYNRYPNQGTTGLAAGQDPANGANVTASPAWKDVNGDGLVQYQVTHDTSGALVSTCTFGTLGCELNFATVASNFGQVTLANHLDPNLKRPYQDKFNVGVSHELVHGVSVSVEWFRTNNKNIQSANGLDQNKFFSGDPALNPNFQPITVYSPLTGQPTTIYDFATAAISKQAVNNVVFTDTDQTSVYNGFDVGFNARLPRGARLFGGTTTERTLNNTCDLAAYNPENLVFCDQSNLPNGYTIPWKTQIKLAGTYPLPFWGLILNGSYQGLPGYNASTGDLYTVTTGTKYATCPGNSAAAGCSVGATIAPSLVSASFNVPLDPTGTVLTARNNQLDFGVAKRLKFGRLRVDPKIDLFNALNSSDYYSFQSVTISPIVNPNATDPTHSPAIGQLAAGGAPTTFHEPSRFLQGRIVRIGANITW